MGVVGSSVRGPEKPPIVVKSQGSQSEWGMRTGGCRRLFVHLASVY